MHTCSRRVYIDSVILYLAQNYARSTFVIFDARFCIKFPSSFLIVAIFVAWCEGGIWRSYNHHAYINPKRGLYANHFSWMDEVSTALPPCIRKYWNIRPVLRVANTSFRNFLYMGDSRDELHSMLITLGKCRSDERFF